jgi:hypothetical protein
MISEYTRADVSDSRRARLWAVVLPLLDKVGMIGIYRHPSQLLPKWGWGWGSML